MSETPRGAAAKAGAAPPQVGAVQSAMVGAIFAIDTIGTCLALATIFFSGALLGGLALATALFVFASIVGILALRAFGQFRLSFAITQDSAVAILAPATALAVAGISGPDEARIATTLAIIAVATLLSGVTFWLVGMLRLGRFVRMLPFPVAAGFLASSGYMVIYAAFSVTGVEMSYTAIPEVIARPEAHINLLAAIVLGAALVVSVSRFRGAVALLVVLALFVVAFYALLFGLGYTVEDAVAAELVPPRPEAGAALFDPALLGLIEWSQVLMVAPWIAAVVLINLIAMLLNTAGVELGLRSDVDLNRELRVTGATNMVVGLFAALTVFVQSGATLIVAKLRVHPVATLCGMIGGLVLGLVFIDRIVSAVPTFVAAGLLMFIGVSMMQDWLFNLRHRLPTSDLAIILGILATTILLGILPAIAVGLMLAVVGFALRSARLPLVRVSTTGAERRSVRDRSAADEAILGAEGHRIRILHLQGTLFFGSVDRMIRRALRFADGTRSAILDFSEVQSFDSSAAAALEKLGYLLENANIATHLSGIEPALRDQLRRWGVPLRAFGEAGEGFVIWPTLDDALEHCETTLLEEFASDARASGDALAGLYGSEEARARIEAISEPVSLRAGEVLTHAHDVDRDIFLLETGRLAVQLPGENGATLRVRRLGPGSVVGELARILDAPRTADIVAETDCTLRRLTDATLTRLEQDDAALALLVYRIIARALSQKVSQTNRLLTYATARDG